MNETATANNPTEANASAAASTSAAATEASTTLLATAGNGTDDTQQTQTTQTQTPPAAEENADGTSKAEETTTTGAPEKYEFTAPEGTAYDPAILDAFAGAAKEANLTQNAAQKLIEKMAPTLAARQADQVKAAHNEWLETSKADKEFGGEKLPENLGVARKALDAFATPELCKLLDETGLGNHPEVIRMFFRAGKAISEDKFVGGNQAGGGKANPANVLYDKTPAGKG